MGLKQRRENANLTLPRPFAGSIKRGKVSSRWRYATGCLIRTALGGLDGNAPRLFLRALGDGNFQHPVDVRGLDGFRIGSLGQREAAQERAGSTLDALEAVLGRLLLRAALTLDGQHAFLGGDLDVLAFNARHIGNHEEALVLFVNIDMRDPADACAVSTLALGTIEMPREAAHERPRLIANDGHKKLLLGYGSKYQALWRAHGTGCADSGPRFQVRERDCASATSSVRPLLKK